MDEKGLSFLDNIPAELLGEYELLFRILVGALLGFIIGLNRTHKHKPAGVKTYMYVTTGATLITIVSIYSAGIYSTKYDHTMMDPMRLAAQIVTGLGFIGAGLILKDGPKVVGLTSAAMLFFTGGIGIGIGAGFYTIIVFSVLITFLFVFIGEWIERREKKKEQGLLTNTAGQDQQLQELEL